MLFEQSVDGGHEFSLIFALFVKFLCLTWDQVKQSPHLLPTVTAFDFAAVRPKLQSISPFYVCLTSLQYRDASAK